MDANAQKVNVEYKKRTGEFLFEYAGGLVAQTFMIADALERAASTDPQKVREALVDARRLLGLRGDGAGRKGKVRSRRQERLRPPGRRAVAERRSGQRLPEGRRPRAADENLKPVSNDVGDSGPGRHQRPAHRRHLRARQHRRHADLRRGQDRQFRPGRIRDDRDVHQLLSRQPVRHRSHCVAGRVDAGAVRRPAC